MNVSITLDCAPEEASMFAGLNALWPYVQSGKNIGINTSAVFDFADALLFVLGELGGIPDDPSGFDALFAEYADIHPAQGHALMCRLRRIAEMLRETTP